MANTKFHKRKVTRPGCICRYCDREIPKGEEMVTGYSWRNRGMYIHLHLECAKEIGKLADGD